MDQLTPTRAREKGIANAAKFMWLAYWGLKDRRKAISLRENADGTFTVLDGNSTFANAKASGWPSIYGLVEETETGETALPDETLSEEYERLFRDFMAEKMPAPSTKKPKHPHVLREIDDGTKRNPICPDPKENYMTWGSLSHR